MSGNLNNSRSNNKRGSGENAAGPAPKKFASLEAAEEELAQEMETKERILESLATSDKKIADAHSFINEELKSRIREAEEALETQQKSKRLEEQRRKKQREDIIKKCVDDLSKTFS